MRKIEELNNNERNLKSQIGILEGEIATKEGKHTESQDLLKQKVTIIAEVFEKKPIQNPQNYSMDVLCDYIFDKAKRLYAKYESVQEELKVLREEHEHYYQKKLSKMQDQNGELKECKEILWKIVIPWLNRILRSSGGLPKTQNLEENFLYGANQASVSEEVKRLLDEMERRYRKYESDSIHAEER